MTEPYLSNVPAEIARVRPIGDFVVVRRLMEPTQRDSGLYLPPAVANRPTGNRRGVVLAIGPGDRMADGSRRAMNVAVGDVVVYSRVPANEIRVDQEVYEIVHEEQHILCVVERTAQERTAMGWDRQSFPPFDEPDERDEAEFAPALKAA